MSKALYRKYRSRTFDEVVGQEHITTTLQNALAKGAISHAYLFTGPRGVGKTSVARILAHAINNLEYTDESTHLDIIEIDAASNRKIDEIRELRSKVHIAPTSAKYKVYIIDEVHMLTREAFNALLKTLEEPPEHAVFILATTEAHKVPDTIISRTQRFTFRPINQESAVNHLKNITKQENLTIEDDALQLLANHGRGSFRDSISMLDQLAGISNTGIVTLQDVQMLLGVPSHTTVTKILDATMHAETDELFEAIQELREQGIHSGRAATSISEELRTMLLAKSSNMNQRKIIDILKNLLPLCTSANDYIGLELALLDNMTPSAPSTIQPIEHETSSSVEKPRHSPSETISKPKQNSQKIEQTVVTKQETPTTTKEPRDSQKTVAEIETTDKKLSKATIQTQPFNNEVWQELLNDLKKKHNTLYGVLRMCQPSTDEGQLLLNFNFGFHKKQVDLPKNTAIVRDYLMNFFGISSFSTRLEVKQKHQPKKATPDTTSALNKNDVISSVSDIFGGAELLE